MARAPDNSILEDLLRGGYVVARGLASSAGVPLPGLTTQRKRPRRRPKATRPQLRARARRQTRPATRRIARQGAGEIAGIQRQGAGLQRKVERATSSAVRTVKSTPTFGLEGGRAARQVEQEVTGLTGDIRSFGRAQSRGAAQLTRQAVAESQAGTQQAISDKRFSRFESLLGQQRTQQQAQRKAQRQEPVRAMAAAIRAMDDPDFIKSVTGVPDEQFWAQWEQAASGEGVSPEVGHRVITAIRNRVESGIPGVPNPTRREAAEFVLERARAARGLAPRQEPPSGVPGLSDIAGFLLQSARESARKAAR